MPLNTCAIFKICFLAIDQILFLVCCAKKLIVLINVAYKVKFEEIYEEWLNEKIADANDSRRLLSKN